MNIYRLPWQIRVSWWLFIDICVTVAIVRGAFFYHHDKSMLFFVPAPFALTIYIGHLLRTRPGEVESQVLSRQAIYAIFTLTVVLIAVLSFLNPHGRLAVAGSVVLGIGVVMAAGLLVNRRWPRRR